MLTCGDGDPDCVPPVKAGIKTRHSYVFFIPQSSTLHCFFCFFSSLHGFMLIYSWHILVAREKKHKHRKREGMKSISAEVWWNTTLLVCHLVGARRAAAKQATDTVAMERALVWFMRGRKKIWCAAILGSVSFLCWRFTRQMRAHERSG